MRNITPFILLILLAINARSQDTIYLSNGDFIPADVLENNQHWVKFKPIGQTGSATKFLNGSEIGRIAFSDGTEFSYMNSGAILAPPIPDKISFQLGFDMISFLGRTLRLVPGIVNPTGTLGLYMPLNFSFGKPEPYLSWPISYHERSVGVGLKYFIPTDVDQWNFSSGFQVVGGTFFTYYEPNDEKFLPFADFNLSGDVIYSPSSLLDFILTIDLTLFHPYVYKYEYTYYDEYWGVNHKIDGQTYRDIFIPQIRLYILFNI